jgi:hypothetical protein
MNVAFTPHLNLVQHCHFALTELELGGTLQIQSLF